jgi:ATP-dependent Clp protease ATP-binding subunit ClpC
MTERGLELVLSDEAKDFLIFKGYNPDYGARPLRRAIENLIENPLAEEILRSAFKGKDLVYVTVTSQDDTKRLKFDATTKREQEESQAALVAVGSENETAPADVSGD